MFDSIIASANERFDLHEKAGTLLSALLSLMTDGTRGGFPGFLERFNHSGLENIVSSWVKSGMNAEISNEQLESVIERNELQNFAKQTGNEYETIVSAVAFMIPRIVNILTPDGVVAPDDNLLTKIGGFLNGQDSESVSHLTDETFDRKETMAGKKLPNHQKKNIQVNLVNRNVSEKPDDIDGSLGNSDNSSFINDSALAWILPLFLLGLLLTLGYWFFSQTPQPTPNATNISSGNSSVDANVNAVNQ